MKCTGDHEDDVLCLEQAPGPLAIPCHKREHQSLGVERNPAEEEGENYHS